MGNRHRVFISYHHANDEKYKNIFQLRFGNKFGSIVPGAVQIGDINPNLKDDTIRRIIRDNYLRNTSVTVILIGEQTWQRKHIDWEISSSMRSTQLNPRSGLLGLILPSHSSYKKTTIDKYTIPPRLSDNIECGYAVIDKWTNNPEDIQRLVHQAYLRKARIKPTNARSLFKKNRSGARWH